MGGRPSLKKTRRDEMRKLIIGFLLVLMFGLAIDVFGEVIGSSWTELNGHWICHQESASFDPGWRCPDGEKPSCWYTICIYQEDNSTQTIAPGCSCY